MKRSHPTKESPPSTGRNSDIHNVTILDKANFLGIAPEALSAAHEPILPKYSMGVPTYTIVAGTRFVSLGVRVPDVRVSPSSSFSAKEKPIV